MSIGLLAGLVLATAPLPASSIKAPQPMMCLGIEGHWSAGSDARRNIETTPVPDSFKENWFSHDCRAWALDRASLLEWHLKFGTPKSTAEALAWVETTSMANVETPQKLQRDTAKDLKKAKNGIFADINRANRDIAEIDAYAFLGEEYLRAAEFWHSPILLVKAKPYIEVSEIGLDIVYPGRFFALQNDPASFPNEFDPHYELNSERELPLRYATL